jgi:hypothetical protein
MRDINGYWIQDLDFFGCCLRVFWRGGRRPFAYGWYNWGFFAFGACGIGCMLWPPPGIVDRFKNRSIV